MEIGHTVLRNHRPHTIGIGGAISKWQAETMLALQQTLRTVAASSLPLASGIAELVTRCFLIFSQANPAK